MDPLVSIVIPAYNAEAWIGETIRSAINQSWPKKEIIIVDDGSRDSTLAVARQFSAKNVCIVTQANAGAAAARNKGFSISQGEFIQWLDADDLLAADKVEKQVLALRRASAQRPLLSSAWGHFLYRTRNVRFHPSPLWCDLAPAEWLLRKMECDVHMQTATWLVSRELTEAAGPWNTSLLGDDDGEYFCRVLRESDGTCFVSEAKTFYRMTGAGSLSYVGRSTKKLEAQFVSCKLHVDYMLSLERSDRSCAACVKYLQKYMLHFYPERSDIVAEMDELAGSLGGRLHVPALSWKYRWIQKLLGLKLAKEVSYRYNRHKSTLLRLWDKALWRLGF